MAKASKTTDTTDIAVLPPEPNTALAMTPDRAIVVEDDADYQDIRDLTAYHGAITFPGANIVPKLHMLGIPFIIVGVRFQDVMPKDGGGFRDFITLDAFVAEEAILRDQMEKGRILKSVGRDAEPYTDMDDLPVKPEERILINDGSTGVRRQIVELLERLELIRVGHDGEFNGDGRRRFDLAWNQWEDPAPVAGQVNSSWINANGSEIPAFRSFRDGNPFIVTAPRGLSGSVYPSEYAPSGFATTYYVR